mmetsp:Transcript_24760/g.37107  ORF Transcript_24760/g.37107 Transcript_24760/m.37107 type:complete len:283 (-) Transcript_24760:43-891(-)|eukprot:CAMPEP_0116004412 /NCGR_PEP_ID=MMETSP0321-20121206/587_1 /TAXON_ID=163516 /ORGANISM="Leptocylindrus danicus var. danicus, Strain B650" /LENGTH=282 /DNA_ID=CAMNT_0003472709 /DNA_START=69 /DNA_END=917 /DNA_ORIENTATION=+
MDQQQNTTVQHRKRQNASFYLQPAHWSPRYDASFFTIEITARETLSAPPEVTRALHPELRRIARHRPHPACYYVVKILYGHNEKIVLRRYAQFRWLYDQVTRFPPEFGALSAEYHHYSATEAYNDADAEKLMFPPKMWPWFWLRGDDHEEARQKDLCAFLTDMLSRPGYAFHPSLIAFLELQSLNTGITATVNNNNANGNAESSSDHHRMLNLGSADYNMHHHQGGNRSQQNVLLRSPALSRSDSGVNSGRHHEVYVNGSSPSPRHKVLMVSTSEGALMDLE